MIFDVILTKLRERWQDEIHEIVVGWFSLTLGSVLSAGGYGDGEEEEDGDGEGSVSSKALILKDRIYCIASHVSWHNAQINRTKNVEAMDVLLKIAVKPLALSDKMKYSFKTGLATWIFNGGYTSLYFEVTETTNQTWFVKFQFGKHGLLWTLLEFPLVFIPTDYITYWLHR